MNNFLCYYGERNIFEFKDGLNLVLGANGYGKSKLYDAFLWIFKDRISDNSAGNRTGFKETKEIRKDLISYKALLECEIGGHAKAEVILEVEDILPSQIKSYRLVRSYIANRKSDSQWIEQEKSKFEICEKDVLHFKPVSETEHKYILDKLLPSDVQDYVWFQGERGINNLIDTSSDSALKNVIKRLSDIDKWDRYISVSQKAFETANSALQKAIRLSDKNQTEIKDRQKRDSEVIRIVESLTIEIDETQKNIHGAQTKHDSLSSIFENAKSLDKLRAEKSRLEKEIESLEVEIDDFYKGFSKNLFTQYWLLGGMSPLTKEFANIYKQYSDKVAERKAEANLKNNLEKRLQTRLPEGVPEPVHIQTMLDKQRCLVCDRPAAKGTPEYDAILQLLEQREFTNEREVKRNSFDSIYRRIYHTALSLNNSIDSIPEGQKSAMLKLQKLNSQASLLREQLKDKDREIQDQLSVSDIDNPKFIVDSFNSSVNDIKIYSGKLGELKEKRAVAQREHDTILKELDRLSEGQIPKTLKTKRDLLSDFVSLTRRVKDKKYEELVKMLEQQANLHYEHINDPTGAFYGKIKFKGTLEGGYRPIIEDNGEESTLLNTSLISSMKLSIIMAIVSANKQRNYANSYPLIADAPTSDFDDVKMKYFLKEASHTFSQAIIITKEMLIDDQTRSKRYKPSMSRLKELKDDLRDIEKELTVYQIDLPDGVSSENKSQIEVEIKTVEV
ncbi:hypothetical protein RT717_18480 [Imperialibacter roseus]|uniref:Rad50/SbcC-type AAA domain-containing protein n=1 Tax=Imperialibacter roseus TaxID=1324217 RepID=A0ABZ0IJ70_9BACT|nr:hypothetical protein [Imperialibacter roseus]WOK05072.1 hypothetical protein RT717_18480 [Imperialibacter roseus]